MVHEGLS